MKFLGDASTNDPNRPRSGVASRKRSLSQILSLVKLAKFVLHISVKRPPVLLAQLRQSQLSIQSVNLPNDAPVRRSRLSLPDVGLCRHRFFHLLDWNTLAGSQGIGAQSWIRIHRRTQSTDCCEEEQLTLTAKR